MKKSRAVPRHLSRLRTKEGVLVDITKSVMAAMKKTEIKRPLGQAAKPVEKDVTPPKASFWDEEEALALVPTPPVVKKAKGKDWLETLRDSYQPLPKKFLEAVSPPGFFGIKCGAIHVFIIGPIGKDWSDVMCYNFDSCSSAHLKREDLEPKEAVDAAISFLQNLAK